jgi:phospholipase C
MRKSKKELLFPNAVSSWGASMGRMNFGTECDLKNGRVYDSTVVLNQGYDEGGAYFGHGKELRVKYSRNIETKELNYVEFYRVGEN